MDNILSLSHVSKNFGELSVIKDLSMTVPTHSVFGFIGKNGAGKTTTMKMILGFLKPDSGKIEVLGEQVVYGSTKTNRFIGYLPDVPEFYGYMRPKEYLNLCGQITGLSTEETKTKSQELLNLVGLEGINRKIQGFSRGMKQRLGIAQALLNTPKLLICDEPTSALDPVGRKDILDILAVVKKQTTVIFSTHILSDVERVCDMIGILDQGELVLEGSMNEINTNFRYDRVLIETSDMGGIQVLREKLLSLDFVEDSTLLDKSIVIKLKDLNKSSQKLLELIVGTGIQINKYEVMEPSLESVFMEVIK